MLAYKIESDEKMDVLRQIAGIKRAYSGVGYTAEEVAAQAQASDTLLREIQCESVSIHKRHLEEELLLLQGRTSKKDRKAATRVKSIIAAEDSKARFK